MKKYHISTNWFERFDIIGQVPSVSNGELVNQSYGATTSPIPVSSWLYVMAANFTTANNLYLFLYDEVFECVGYAQITSSGVIKSVDISGYTMASYVRISVDNLASFTADNGTIMFNDGLEPLPYEPFMSDNLFNETQWMDYNKWTDSAGTTHNEGYGYQCYLLWSGGDITAKVHGELPYSYSACFYDSSDTFISRTHFTSEYMGNANTISVPSGTAKIIFQVACPTTEYIDYDTVRSYKIMVNSGSTAKPYVPYGTSWQPYTPPKRGTATDSFTTLPATIHGDGTNATAIEIQGNMTQTGTPTSASPIFPSETGERTENLFNGTTEQGSFDPSTGRERQSDTRVRTSAITLPQGTYTISAGGLATSAVIYVYDTSDNYVSAESLTSWLDFPSHFTISTTRKVKFAFRKDNSQVITPSDVSEIMLSEGLTAPSSYEPYGFVIPIICGGVTTNYYLSEPIRKIGTYVDTASAAVTRVIKKLVLTGQEDWNVTGGSVFYLTSVTDYLIVNAITTMCSHYRAIKNIAQLSELSNGDISFGRGNYRVFIKDTQYSTTTDYKTYLQQQYANGTPVTVWYVLATAETESVTVPTIPTIDSEQTFDVSTTLKPSSASITYHGWHRRAEKKRENGDWT